jgi:hypothetical protein
MMIVEQRLASLNAARPSASLVKTSSMNDRTGRLIQIALALYLIPALLVVLAVGGLGMLILGFARLLTGPVRGSLG